MAFFPSKLLFSYIKSNSIANCINLNNLKYFLKINNIFFIEEDLIYILNEISDNNFGLINFYKFETFWKFFYDIKITR